jgi:hypothetical protein
LELVPSNTRILYTVVKTPQLANGRIELTEESCNLLSLTTLRAKRTMAGRRGNGRAIA